MEQLSLQLTVSWEDAPGSGNWFSRTLAHSGDSSGLEVVEYREPEETPEKTFTGVYSNRLFSAFGAVMQTDERPIRFSNTHDALFWLVCREGSLSVELSPGEPVTLESGEQQLFYLPGGREVEAVFRASHASFYLLAIGSSFFRYFLAEDSYLKSGMATLGKMENAGWLYEAPKMLQAQQYGLIHELANCRRTGAFKRIFTASKAIEMLLLLQEISAEGHADGMGAVSTELQQRIEEVRTQLDADLKMQPTIAELARQVGTNASTFKQVFKVLFGTTVFAYHQRRKMETAMQWLQQKELRVGEISERLGYKNQQHFSIAFKKYFGIRPSAIR